VYLEKPVILADLLGKVVASPRNPLP
jgi:hypothetical protein